MQENVSQVDVLAAAVATGRTVKLAAASIGMTERQAYEISRTSEFKEKLADIRAELVSDTVDSMRQLLKGAVERLGRNIEQGSDKIANDAIKTLFGSFAKMGEYADFQRRLDELERADGERLLELIKELGERLGVKPTDDAA